MEEALKEWKQLLVSRLQRVWGIRACEGFFIKTKNCGSGKNYVTTVGFQGLYFQKGELIPSLLEGTLGAKCDRRLG